MGCNQSWLLQSLGDNKTEYSDRALPHDLVPHTKNGTVSNSWSLFPPPVGPGRGNLCKYSKHADLKSSP